MGRRSIGIRLLAAALFWLVPALPAGAQTPRPLDGVVQDFHVSGGRIMADGRPLTVHGVNWSGLDTTDRAPHGLWTGRPIREFLRFVRDLGFTALRIPITSQVLQAGYPVAPWAAERGYGPSGSEMLVQTLAAAYDANLWVVLAFNTYDPRFASGGDTPSPINPGGRYDKEDWLADLRTMASRAATFQNVIGIDLFNEPHGLSWQEWRSLAGDAGEAVLTANPRLLVFVQGVAEKDTDTAGYGAFWGANLVEAARYPVDPRQIPGRKLVYSPHVYGPDVYLMPYFRDGRFPTNMPSIWDAHFGYLAGRHAVCPGEFGGHNAPGSLDEIWHAAFVQYLPTRPGMAQCWFYWQLNPNSEDTGGILSDSWAEADGRKIALLRWLKRVGQ